ncbi:hypothetical protein OTU49_000750 [Cherax quadricarinatus]|uniref:Uncharacterized protein n=1 Tax=Cherax quadricarinatus TaxID=27406 RepID=A0AAW0XWV5_CHEQU
MIERPASTRFTHFGSVRFQRRDPDGFDAADSLPSSIPTFVSRSNPLMRLASLVEERASSPQHDDHSDSVSGRKVKLSNFPKDSSWFRSQKDRKDSFMEASAETIFDDGSPGGRTPGSRSVFYDKDDDASSS